jgi:hypothetical protein
MMFLLGFEWWSVDAAWEQEKLEAGKLLENGARREAAVHGVSALSW